MKPIRVLIVDDSAMVRKVLTNVIKKEPDMEVVGTAPDPFIARDKLVKLKPDVMTLDIEMPRMDGLTFLSKVMHYFPIPTLIVSSVTSSGCKTSLKALELGAVNVIPKPDAAYSIDKIERHLTHAIRTASKVKIKRIEKQVKANVLHPISITTTNKIIAIGASTGGTEAIKEVITLFPKNIPGTIIVQHMPATFTKAFAERMNTLCQANVKEAADGDVVKTGVILIAPGDYHMVLRREGAKYFVRLKKGPQVWHQRPAVDVLFNSVAKYAGSNSIGVILTGMGRDGATGLKNMLDCGAKTIAQDEKTSVVYGMPKAAVDENAVETILPIDQIANQVVNLLHKM